MNNEDNMDNSGEATDQPHAFQVESEEPVSSNLTQLTDDITNQLARAFHITDHHDDPLFLPALFTNPVNTTTTEQHIREEPDGMSLDSSPQILHSVSGTSALLNTQQSPSTTAASHEVNNTTAAARSLAGILKKNKGGKTGKKVKFAAPPGKVVKCYKSSQAMASWLRPLKSILQIVSSKDRQTAKLDKKKVIVVMPGHQLLDGGDDKDKDKDEEGAGTDYHNSFPVVGASSIDDLVEYIRQATACPKQTRNLKDYWKHQRGGDVRTWGYRNPWCTKCYGECPICGTACCVYEELKRAVSDEASDPLVSRDRRRIMDLMGSVGAYIKDASTFSLCSTPGCGKHVCPSCCGICPDKRCRDVQCKRCCLGVQGRSLGRMRLARVVSGAPRYEARQYHDEVTIIMPMTFVVKRSQRNLRIHWPLKGGMEESSVEDGSFDAHTSRSPRSGEVEAEANQPRAGAVTCHRLARLRTAPQLCQSHEQLAAETASTQPPNANRQHLVSTGCASQTFKMRTYDDSFSGQKIYPGKGKLYVRGDSKIFRFQNGKSESLFLQRKNPRRIAWTVLYRRQHKKGISEEVAKKRTRRVVKSQRAIVGASLDVIKERRAQRPEARAAARQQAIKDAKEKKAANESRKRAEKAKAAASGAKPAQRIQSKQGAKGSAPKVAAKSR
ncbi:60S ribosomal protein L24 [Aspergillus niger]|nr:60S ribosomal protein L24 [Aspergillus niger]